MKINVNYMLSILFDFNKNQNHEKIYDNYYKILNGDFCDFLLINVNNPQLLMLMFNSLEAHILYCILNSYYQETEFYAEHFLRFIQELVYIFILRVYFNVEDMEVTELMNQLFFLDSEMLKETIVRIKEAELLVREVSSKSRLFDLDERQSLVLFDEDLYQERLDEIKDALMDLRNLALSEVRFHVETLTSKFGESSLGVLYEFFKIFLKIAAVTTLPHSIINVFGVEKERSINLKKLFRSPNNTMMLIFERCQQLQNHISEASQQLLVQASELNLINMDKENDKVRQDCAELLQDDSLDPEDKECLGKIFKSTCNITTENYITLENVTTLPKGFLLLEGVEHDVHVEKEDNHDKQKPIEEDESVEQNTERLELISTSEREVSKDFFCSNSEEQRPKISNVSLLPYSLYSSKPQEVCDKQDEIKRFSNLKK